ncbi:uncharacterized protein N7479_000090 [Penicillium vulpinum]|uniref:uncharacterized protein n=1 Tax=Penicillium vulpinum TaxID=29845 RepID=UPI002547BBE1|nr:uncharacterized protein N7479_000090 [Penicillium vulpinum]KAJ5970172.1 hypothetical protein N7479_000090 [Penicillium vulpinum]
MARPILEGLPTELLILILLEIPDLTSLKFVVLSSPIFYQVYLTARQRVLCHIVKSQWGVLLGDAMAATRSRGLFFDSRKHEAIAVLDTWRRKEEIRNLAWTSSNRIDEPGSLEEILHLLYLHKAFDFFLEDYAKNIPQPPWMEDDQLETSILPIELSQTEKHRLLRALCRLQTYKNIFGYPERRGGEEWIRNNWDLKKQSSNDRNSGEEAYRVFFGTIPPWEYHEMACVWVYFTTMFDPIYEDITTGLYDLVEKYRSKDPQDAWQRPYFIFLPEEARLPMGGLESLQSLENLPDQSKSLASMGPEFVYRLLHSTPLIQRDMVILNTKDDIFSSFSGSWLLEEDKLPFLYPADRHALQNYEQFWSTLPYIEQPNLGWKKMHLVPDTPEQTFEDAIDLEGGHESVWRLGLAIFDDERLMAWKAPLSEYRLGQVPDTTV